MTVQKLKQLAHKLFKVNLDGMTLAYVSEEVSPITSPCYKREFSESHGFLKFLFSCRCPIRRSILKSTQKTLDSTRSIKETRSSSNLIHDFKGRFLFIIIQVRPTGLVTYYVSYKLCDVLHVRFSLFSAFSADWFRVWFCCILFLCHSCKANFPHSALFSCWHLLCFKKTYVRCAVWVNCSLSMYLLSAWYMYIYMYNHVCGRVCWKFVNLRQSAVLTGDM